MHVSETALIHIHHVVVRGVIEQSAPWHIVCLGRERYVAVPPELLSLGQFGGMLAALAVACCDEGVVVDAFVGQFAKSVPACFVLDDTSHIVGIRPLAARTERDGRTVGPHLRHTLILGSVGYHDDECAAEVACIHCGSAQCVAEYLVGIGRQAACAVVGGAEACGYRRVGGAYAIALRECDGRIYIEVLAV